MGILVSHQAFKASSRNGLVGGLIRDAGCGVDKSEYRNVPVSVKRRIFIVFPPKVEDSALDTQPFEGCRVGGQGFSLSNGLTFQNICAGLVTVKLVARGYAKALPGRHAATHVVGFTRLSNCFSRVGS